jgi:polyphenol oxidase
MPNSKLQLIPAQWSVEPDQAPAVSAFCTTREGGVSKGNFAFLNLAEHVQDDPEAVVKNRQLLKQQLALPDEPQWLQQTHSINVIDLDSSSSRKGDAAFSSTPGRIAVVMTADCLPVLFCNTAGSEVAAAHAGWRGLLNGILEKTVASMCSRNQQIMAWLGPAIGPAQFEVGSEVRDLFIEQDAESASCFSQNRPGHYLADLYSLARTRLHKAGVSLISGGEFCTFSERERFFSYRRENLTGRQASLIYINKNP